ncbi:radical SAM protein [[Clostridium] scindens]|uniref:radical SAM protein n=1 Tax=Clostridium scindens (strain JCM 10418 / VPI 12708) TaxID=29347 RepID=UPI00156DAAF2|nr:radical SAM protein [[Clostridium] scindens]NSI89445.1 radical SAM protein [[Clostridium] scindens]NSJ05448.1 radical SAM protein [[Clostridium] scindens]
MFGRVERAKEKAFRGETFTKEELIELLSIDPKSEEVEALGMAAHEVAQEVTEGKARLWGAIGVDYKPCEMDCKFCSLGKSWGIVKEEKEYTLKEMIRQVRYYVENDFHYILLRSTEFYDPNSLGKIMKSIREAVPGDYELGCNIGELEEADAEYMYECGGRIAYHCIRLREGVDTRFRVEDRVHTVEVIRDSKMKFGFWVEPMGVEHTNEEIAEKILETLHYQTDVCGVMARVPVAGTPFENVPMISEKRMAQITAVLRLACGRTVKDICTHPASELAVRFGANVITLETGAIPRDADFQEEYWKGLHIDQVKEWLNQNGYHI